LVLAYAAQHPRLAENSGNLALLETATELGLIEKKSSDGVRDIYRQLRLTQHQMRLNNLNACRIEHNRLNTSSVSSLWKKLLLE
jgi:glutamate-ammonia-ligase adenylyltransferase